MRLMKNNRGTSLVEVLVVMVVLLLGIMTIVRLYPTGFQSVRHAESITFANRLAQYELERWKNNSANLPDGVLPIDDSGAVLNDQNGGPPIVEDYNGGVLVSDNATTFRRVIGETTKIPFGGWSIDSPSSGSMYVLAFGPISNTAGSLAVRGGNLTRRVFDSSDGSIQPWAYLRGSQYGIDYGEQGEKPQFCFPVAMSDRQYFISYSWWERGSGEPVMKTATSIPVRVAANTRGWISLTQILNDAGMSVPTGFIGLDQYSDTAARGFLEVANFSSDAYEFKLLDPVLGILSFNPLGYSQTEFGHSLEAKIDYDILDLQIIREDKRVSQSGPFIVNLTLHDLKETGVSVEVNGDTYQGIHPPVIPAGVDVMAIDLETLMAIPIEKIWIDYKAGIINLPATVTLVGEGSTVPNISPAGRNIRFYYKAEGDWSLQFQKAYVQYERRDSGTLDFKSYMPDASDFRKIWLSACNVNHSIAVDYDYLDNSGQVRKVVGENHKATDALDLLGSTKCTYITLDHDPIRIYSVNGVSARARVLWREGERWRHVQLDTILTRK